MLQKHFYRWLIGSIVILSVAGASFFLFSEMVMPSTRTSIKQQRYPIATQSSIPSSLVPTISPSVAPPPQPSRPVQLSSDPYTNPSSQHQTEVEPASSAYGSTIVAAFQAGRFVDVASSNIGWATSRDGGAHWQHGFLPATTSLVGGPYGRITDPSVAYDAASHTWMISSIGFLNTADIYASVVLVSRSTNGGTIWSPPVIVMDDGIIGGLDKDWLTCDTGPASRFSGRCYLAWDNYHRNDLLQVSTSSDGGRTWSTARTTVDQASGFSSYPLVQPDGTVIVPMTNANQTVISMMTSTDGGASWEDPVGITTVVSFPLLARFANSILFTTGVDRSGSIYLVWLDCRFEPHCGRNDLVMMTSSDGRSWSPVRRLALASPESGITYAVPGLGIDPNTGGSAAHLGVAFYAYAAACTGNCTLSVDFASSLDGGKTWSPVTKVGGPFPLAWAAAGSNSVGDYLAVAFSNDKAFPIFALAASPENGDLNESIYTIEGGMPVGPSVYQGVGHQWHRKG